MHVQIIGDGIEVDSRIQEIIQDKIVDELQKYLTDFDEDLQKATVKIEKLGHHGFKANFNMQLPGKNGHIYSEEEGDDLINLLIALRKEVEREIRDYKSKLQDY